MDNNVKINEVKIHASLLSIANSTQPTVEAKMEVVGYDDFSIADVSISLRTQNQDTVRRVVQAIKKGDKEEFLTTLRELVEKVVDPVLENSRVKLHRMDVVDDSGL